MTFSQTFLDILTLRLSKRYKGYNIDSTEQENRLTRFTRPKNTIFLYRNVQKIEVSSFLFFVL